jgi:hypothetical protein
MPPHTPPRLSVRLSVRISVRLSVRHPYRCDERFDGCIVCDHHPLAILHVHIAQLEDENNKPKGQARGPNGVYGDDDQWRHEDIQKNEDASLQNKGGLEGGSTS